LLEGRRLLLRGRDGVMLPLNVQLGDVRIAYSPAEITKVEEGGIEFRLTQARDVIALETDREIASSEDYEVNSHGKTKTITSRKRASVDDRLGVRWR
jgi:beta-galactosidase